MRNCSRVASRFAQTGRSMIEMLGVLAIIGVLSVGGIAGYSKAMMKYRTNKTIEQVTMIATNIRTLFANQNNFDDLGDLGITNINLITKAKIVPEEMITKDGLKNAFGGDVFIFSAGSGDVFVIGMTIPQEACITLMTQDWGDGKPHSVSRATEKCEDEENLIEWFYGITEGGSITVVN